MSYLIVIPSINPEWAKACQNSFYGSGSVSDDFFIVDNQTCNNGVAGAWNLGIDEMFRRGDDWLVICSESVRFGDKGKDDLNLQLLVPQDKSILAKEADNGLGWHLIAFRKEVFEKVGYFDEMFYPAYFEDNDFSYRYQRAYGITEEDYPLWPKVNIDATLIGVAEGLKHVKTPIDMQGLQDKYVQKWGGVSPNETFLSPYNNSQLTYRYAERHKH